MALQNPYVSDKGRQSSFITTPYEFYSLYLNFDNGISDLSFANYDFAILDQNGVVNKHAFTNLKKDIINAGLYNIYVDFIMPNIPSGFYSYAIIDTTNGNLVKCKSQLFYNEQQYDLIKDYTTYFVYRNNTNKYGIGYERLPDYYNKIRLPINMLNYTFESTKTQYRNVSDKKLRDIISFLDKLVTLETYFTTQEFHEGVAAIYEHDTIFINNLTYIPKAAYTINSSSQSVLLKGLVDAYEEKTLYDDFFLGGGIDGLIICNVTTDILIQCNF